MKIKTLLATSLAILAVTFLSISCSKNDDDEETIVYDESINVIDQIKDPVFKEYVKVKVRLGHYEAEASDVLRPSEAAKITELNFTIATGREDLRSLEGIEYFTGLKEVSLNGTAVGLIDLGKNLKIEKINLPDCTAESVKIISPTVKNIYAKNAKVKSMEVNAPLLTEIACIDTNLTSLNISACPKLEKLTCGGSKIVSLDLSNNLELKDLRCGGAGNISSRVLDISKNTKLRILYAGMGNQPLKTLYVWWDGGRDNVPSNFDEFFIESATEVVKK